MFQDLKRSILGAANYVPSFVQNAINRGRAKEANGKIFAQRTANVGRALQNVPSTKITLPQVSLAKTNPNPVTRPYTWFNPFPETTSKYGGKIVEFATALPSDIIQGYGKSLERLSTPSGRKEIQLGVVDLVTKKPSLETLSNPAVQTALDVSDFIPGIGFISLGTKPIVKEAGEKFAREAVEKVGREAEEKLVKEAGETALKDIERETAERVFKKETAPKSLLQETAAQTKFRRNLNLSPDEVYQTAEDIETSFRSANRVKPSNVISNVETLKDISPTEKGFKDVYRNFEKVFGNEYPTIKKTILDPFDSAKKSYVNMIKHYEDALQANVISKGIKKGSKESAALQLYGEGKMVISDLVNNFGKDKAREIIAADKWFRNTYNELIDTVNATRRQLYPYNPEMIIPHRKNYYRHFEELNGFEV